MGGRLMGTGPGSSLLAERLAFLLGRHTGTDEVHPSPWGPGRRTAVTTSAESVLSGAVVVQRYVEHQDGAVLFEVLNVFSTDPATGEVLLHAHDSVGFPPDPPARGVELDGVLVLHRDTARGSSRTSFEPLPQGFRWAKSSRLHDAEPWTPVVDGELTREGG